MAGWPGTGRPAQYSNIVGIPITQVATRPCAPSVAFERYADDGVVHCVSRRQAEYVLAALQKRMAAVGLQLHPDKTRIVYCQDGRRRGTHSHTSFTFLGYTFRPREVRRAAGRKFTGILPANSKAALKRISREV
jgi:RNA-directed DNA polymerase